MAKKGTLITGARARLSVEGVKIGYATGVTVSEAIQYEEAIVLDNIEVEEHVPVGYNVSFTTSLLRVVDKTLKSLGIFPSVGGSTSEHLENILVSGVLEATIEDVPTKKIFAMLEQCRIAGHDWSLNPRGILSENVTWVAIRVRDESEVPA